MRLTLTAHGLALALGLAAVTALPARATDLGAMTDAERQAFRAEVRAYLLDNPEVLMEAINILDQRQQAAAADADTALATANRDALMNDGFSYVGGNPNGDITLVEFLDYRCGYCRKAHDEVAELVRSDGNIRFVVKEFPILGPQSTLSSQFAIAVQQLHGDDVYFQVHEALMAMQAEATPESLTRLATSFGLDPAPIMDRMTSPEVAKIIQANHALGQTMKITGTPTFVLEDQMLRGYLPLAQMRQVVDQVRTE